MKTVAKELVEQLSAEQADSLRNGLLRKLTLGSAFAANLRVMGLKEEAAEVERILRELGEL
jgi:hypothetical protein